ncbi:Pentatricopeptide repeat-containing protein [Quillaja saponaria]|uniref:Pentatricopeptide repeat-containing protein n=1 Tax=Quillaja saponaria TaxID=32244 RepID=A0AAD7VLP4_QUISA|nr:Pentatricopeptide repeat-containing protein [Quillaja saponaria]
MLISKLTTLLKSCFTLNHAKQIHAHILINGVNHLEPLLVHQILLLASNNSKRITQYVKQILYHLRNPHPFPWGCTIRFFSQKGQFMEAISLYVQMQRVGLRPSSYAISSTLRSCARMEYKLGGISIHGQLHRFGFNCCVYALTALVDLYSKLGDMEIAKKVFDEMAEKNVVSWNSMLSGYLTSGNVAEAHKFFEEIPKKDVISWNSMVSGYAKVGDMDKACSLFLQMPEKNLASWNAMVSCYVEFGSIESAQNIFDLMPVRNNLSWMTMISGYSKTGDVESARRLFDQMDVKDLLSCNAMIACYSQNSKPKEALELFDQMLKPELDIHPDEMTLVSIISACAQLGDSKYGLWIDSYMNKFGIALDDHLATALIDFYAKCGNIHKAYVLFHGLRKRDLVAYSAMIYGCGINGNIVDATKLFEEMIEDNICPNSITYTGMLTAYSHTGLVEEGYRCFNSIKEYGLVPSVDHYGIMVDLLGRAGELDKAYQLIIKMPMQPNAGVWGALLLACRIHNNIELGEVSAQHCFKLESETTGYFSLLSSIYSSVGRWDDARRLWKGMEGMKFTKIPGCSWTDFNSCYMI